MTEGGSMTVGNGDGTSKNNQHDGENPQSLTREESRQGWGRVGASMEKDLSSVIQ